MNVIDFQIDNNKLSGTLADFNMKGVIIFDAANNMLSGTIPEFSSFGLVRSIDLSSNMFTGSLPSFSKSSRLLSLDASDNLLESIADLDLPKLNALHLSYNRIKGPLPNLNIPNLEYLDLSFNRLDQPLPEWNVLKSLRSLDLFGNSNITGPLPHSMDNYKFIAQVNILETAMKANSTKLLPASFQTSDVYGIQSPIDMYQCPVITVVNKDVTKPRIDMVSSYYEERLCKCLPNHFGINGICIPCNTACECPDGLSIAKCYPSPSLLNVTNIILCPNPRACNGYISQVNSTNYLEERHIVMCETGYTDRVCSNCKAGYGLQGRTCIRCDEDMLYAFMVISPIMIIGMLIYLFKSGGSSSGKFRILVFHIQTLSIISSVFTSSKAVNSLVEISMSISSIQLPNLSCILDSTEPITLIGASFIRIPLIIIVGVVIYILSRGPLQDKVVFITLHLCYFIYYGISKDVFSSLGCTLYDRGQNAWYLNQYPWVQCSLASNEYVQLFIMSIVVLFIFVIGMPALIRTILVKNPTHNDAFEKRYGFLYLAYRKECRFWELVFIARRIAFTAIVSIVPYTEPGVLFLLLVLVIQLSIWIQHRVHPYADVFDNGMETVSLYVIFLSLFLALLESFLANQAWISVILITLNAIVIACFLVFGFIKPFFHRFLNSKGITSIVPVSIVEVSSFEAQMNNT
eukprot:TRINITY_DN5115_c0_g1_i11.p1 TRINITY_DN5115_c0_g1~~TRINITY_DN5115_c0_g1_i11.p1  ORF type:complete len:688 (+),score=82.88 TRINITY_DN5115_c0_g1_i11:458-2521(+)